MHWFCDFCPIFVLLIFCLPTHSSAWIFLKKGQTYRFGECRTFRNVTSNSIKPWYHCPRDGGQAEIHKKIYNSKINQRDIQLRRRWGSSAKYMPNSLNFTVQLRRVSRSFWLFYEIEELFCLVKTWINSVNSHRQIFSDNKYKNNIMKIVNKIIMADNITGSDSHMKKYRINTPVKTFQQMIASTNFFEKIYYHNLTLIIRKFLTSTGIGSNTKTTAQQLLNEEL